MLGITAGKSAASYNDGFYRRIYHPQSLDYVILKYVGSLKRRELSVDHFPSILATNPSMKCWLVYQRAFFALYSPFV